MRTSIRSKLGLGVSVLIIAIIALVALVVIQNNKRELTRSIYDNGLSFAELSVGEIVNDYNLYLKENSFVFFNREINDLRQKNDDISAVSLYNYAGAVLYDSVEEATKQYSGVERTVSDTELLDRIQATYPSVKLLDSGRVVYLKKMSDGSYASVNDNEEPADPVGDLDRIENIVFPYDATVSAVFTVSYENLDASIASMMQKILLMAVIAFLAAVFFAVVFAAGITRPIKKLTDGVSEFAHGNLKARVDIKTNDEINTLGDTFNQMAADLEKSTKALIYKERVAKELELAANIQKQLLPKQLPAIDKLDLAAGLIPAEEIGGDVFDFMSVDDTTTLFYVGDVTGHGVPAGLIVSVANALLYSYKDRKSPKEILVDTNKIVQAKTTANMFLTLIMLAWDNANEVLTFANAGHEQILYWDATKKRLEQIESKGMALGMMPDIEKLLEEKQITMKSGDVVTLYSDGIPEAWNENKEMYGMGRFKRAVADFSEELQTAEAVKNAIIADVKEFAGKANQEDDITVMVIKKR